MSTPETQRPLRWFDVRWWVPVAALLLALHAWLALSAAERMGPTYDEPLHLVSGYTYWRLDDYRMQPENGNLPQRWAGATLIFDARPPRLPALAGNPEWTQTQYGLFCETVDYFSGNPYYYYLFRARAAMLVFSAGLGLLVFVYSKKLWGPAGGCLSLALYCLEPSFLANAPLVTSDLCASFCLWLATIAYWWSLQKNSMPRALLGGLALGLACVAKFSAVLVVPVCAALLALAVILGRGGDGGAARRTLRLCGLSLAQILVAWAVVWTFFGWRYAAPNPAGAAMEQFVTPWPVIYTRMSPWMTRGIDFLRAHRALPEAYLYGFSNVVYYAKYRAAFLDGAISDTGWWYFFPFAFAMKTSLSALAAFALAAGLAARTVFLRIKARQAGAFRPWVKKWTLLVAPLAVFFAIYWAFALASTLDIGQRHILPTYVPLFILAGALAARARHRLWRVLAAALALGLAAESFAVRPDYLAFFNRLCGGPSEGYRHLVDSSLDWGQELPALADWVRDHRRPGEPVYLAYFGIDLPDRYPALADSRRTFQTAYSHVPLVLHPLEGGLYCVSATSLSLVYASFGRPWTVEDEAYYQNLRRAMDSLPPGKISPNATATLDQLRFARLCVYLRTLRPLAEAGHGVLIYRLTDREAALAANGSWNDYASMVRGK